MSERETIVSASLETADLAKGFNRPLVDLLKVGVEKLVVKFSTEDGISINAVNTAANVMCMVTYADDMVEAFDIKEDYSLGLYELSQFINLFSVFSSGADLSIYATNEVLVEKDMFVFKCRGSDADAIKQGPKSFTAQVNWLAEFKWDKVEMKSFSSAVSKLGKEYICFEGKEGSSQVKISSCDINVAGSTFAVDVDLEDPSESSFKHYLRAENLMPILGSSMESIGIQISDQLVYIYGGNDLHSVKYYVSRVDKE